MGRTKAGFSLAAGIARELDVLAFVLQKTRSEIVEEGVAKVIKSLNGAERKAYVAATSARVDTLSPTPPAGRAA